MIKTIADLNRINRNKWARDGMTRDGTRWFVEEFKDGAWQRLGLFENEREARDFIRNHPASYKVKNNWRLGKE